MKRRIILVLAVMVFALSGLSAAIEAELSLGASETGMSINMTAPEDGAFNTRIEAGLESIVDLYLKKGNGVDILFGTDFSRTFKLGAGYAYKSKISSSSDLVAAAGPYFIFGNGLEIGVYARADINLHLTSEFFVKIGTGLDVEFLQFRTGGTTTDVDILLPLPRVAFGWKL